MRRIPFGLLEFAFECFQTRSNHSNLLRLPLQWLECIRMLRISFERFILHSNASNLVGIVRICIRMLQIWFEWFEFAFEWLEFGWNGSNLHSNG